MGMIQWSDTLSVDIKEIDEQHQHLVKLINELHDAMQAKKGKEALGKILEELIDYTKSHFSVEERYFRQFGYPDTENHKREHVKFVEKVAEFQKSFNAGGFGTSISVLFFLGDWLRNHIKGSDKKYVPFLKEKGLT